MVLSLSLYVGAGNAREQENNRGHGPLLQELLDAVCGYYERRFYSVTFCE